MALEGNFSTAIVDLVEDLVTADKVNINQAIFQETFGIGSFVNSHSLRTGVRPGSLISIVLAGDNYCAMPAGDELSCELNDCDLTPQYQAKKWDLAEYNCRIPICMRTFDENFLAFWNMYRQRLDNPLEAPDAQAFLTYITTQVERNILGAQWRVGYWGDTSATTNNLINANNGYFVQAEAGSGIKASITSAGAEPTAEEILDSIEAALGQASNQMWLGADDVVIKMSWTVANKIAMYLNRVNRQNPYNCDCVSADGIVSADRFSVEGLRLFGYRVEAHREIDGGAGCVTDADVNKILIARKSNLLVGTNELDKMSMFDIFYDKRDRMIYVDSAIYLGVSIPLDEYIYLTVEEGGEEEPNP